MSKKIPVFIWLLIFAFNSSIKSNINNLSETLVILKPDYYSCSILHGVLAHESGWVMHIYDSAWERTPGVRKNMLVDAKKAPEFIRLIDHLYHRPPNTVGRATFTPTKPIKDLGGEAVAMAVADILAVTFEPVFEAFLKRAEKIDKNKLHSYKEYSQLIKIIAESAKRIFVPEKILLSALLGECDNTKMALLALVWFCCGESKATLSLFYKKLDEKCMKIKKESIFIKNTEPNWDKWITTIFNKNEIPEIQQKLDKAFSTYDIDAIKLFEEKPQLYEELVYFLFSSTMYPKISSYRSATLFVDGKETDFSFADCDDSTVMNFVNMLVLFDLEHFKQKYSLASPNNKLKNFYAGKHPAFGDKVEPLLPESVEEKRVHNAWSDVISNIPGVAYSRCVIDGQEIQSSWDSKGYVLIDEKYFEKYSKLFSLQRFVPVVNDGKAICYEKQPAIRGFIVALNHILGLDLFKDKIFYEELLRKDFIKTYLPIMGQCLNITFEPDVDLDKIDAIDYGSRIETKVFFDGSASPQFILSTSSGHGELRFSGISQKDISARISYRIATKPSRLISLWGVKFLDSVYNSDGLTFYDMFWHKKKVSLLDLANYNVRLSDQLLVDFFAKHIEEEGKNSNDILRCYATIIYSSNAQNTQLFLNALSYVKNLKGLDTSEINSALLLPNVFTALVCKGYGLDEAFEYAKYLAQAEQWQANLIFTALINKNYKMDEMLVYAKKLNAWQLCLVLIDKDYGLDEVFEHAKHLIKTNQGQAIQIFIALINKNYKMDEMLKYAKKLNLRDLLLALIDKGYGLDDAFERAKHLIKTNQWQAIQIFKALISKNYKMDEMLAYAKKLNSSDLLLALIDKNYGLDEVLKYVMTLMKTDHELALTIFAALKNKGLSLPQENDISRAFVVALCQIVEARLKKLLFFQKANYYWDFKEKTLICIERMVKVADKIDSKILDISTQACRSIFNRRWFVSKPSIPYNVSLLVIQILTQILNKMSADEVLVMDKSIKDRIIFVFNNSCQSVDDYSLFTFWEGMLSKGLGLEEALDLVKVLAKNKYTFRAENLLEIIKKYAPNSPEIGRL